MKTAKILLIVAVLVVLCNMCTACMTPDKWPASDHRDQMQYCRVMCGDNVESYDPWLGKCMCSK